MRVRVVAPPAAADVAALAGFPAEFSTETVFAVDGFVLTERPGRVRKRYELAGDWDALLLAEDGGQVVGVAATTYRAWNRRQVLDELHVRPERRRAGIARVLVGEVGTIARANGARELWAETQNVNVPAVRAYERLGFTLTGLDTTLYGTDEVALFLSMPV